MNIDSTTTKYLIHAKIYADGIIDKPDVVGAVFGQTEGLLGDDLDLRDLQKSGRMGRIEVEIQSQKGKTEGTITIPSSLDIVETAILASSLETIDRIGPCKSKIEVTGVEDVRLTRRTKIIEKAKMILGKLVEENKNISSDLTEAVRSSIQIDEIVAYGKEKLPAGPHVDKSDAIIVVEGRSDVINLLKHGIKNTIAVEGTNVPETIKELSKEKTVTVFVDGDRGGELILRELLQVADIDYVARAPRGSEVEELTQKQIMKCLRNKITLDQYLELYGDPSESNNNEQQGQSQQSREQSNSNAHNGLGNMNHANQSQNISNQKNMEKKPMPPNNFNAQNVHIQNVDGNTAMQVQQPSQQSIQKPQNKVQGSEPKKVLSPVMENYKKSLQAIIGTYKARMLDDNDNIIKDVEVKNLVDILLQGDVSPAKIILDGVLSQRLIDVAENKGVKVVVGLRIGDIIRVPVNLKLITRKDLEL
ncbi:MAG: DNA primase DnaG [Thermoplasmata archaeon]